MHHTLSRAGMVWVALAGSPGCTSSIQLTLRGDVSDGATGVASLKYRSGGVGWHYPGCFQDGVCEMLLGPESVHGAHDVRLLVWADPEDDDQYGPEADEPIAETTLDVPEKGILEVTLDLE